jgi:hypothetical protein
VPDELPVTDSPIGALLAQSKFTGLLVPRLESVTVIALENLGAGVAAGVTVSVLGAGTGGAGGIGAGGAGGFAVIVVCADLVGMVCGFASAAFLPRPPFTIARSVSLISL